MVWLRGWLAHNRVDVLLFAFAIVLLGPIVAGESAQPASRAALTGALAEHHRVDIGGYPIGVDYAIYHGKRADKAPGQPIAAVPVYLVERAFGAESLSRLRPADNLTLWWLTFW